MKHGLTLTALLFSLLSANAQTFQQEIAPLEGEKWWGGFVGIGSQMPFPASTRLYDLSRENFNNQIVPLMLSSAGRYVWSEQPFSFQLRNDTLVLLSAYETPQAVQAGATLREAYLAASAKHFPPSGKLPEELFFSKPQYNTWIELMYNQNQKDILDYADKVIAHHFPTGVFMVDDNWQKHYGNFEFKPERFPDAAAMIARLHQQHFRVMLWICPFVTLDTPEYHDLAAKGFLLKQKGENKPAQITWWNGTSACYDLTNPAALAHFKEQLQGMQRDYGVDGFKFDAGDISYMDGSYDFHDPAATVNLFSQRWGELALDFPFNELRTSWKLGGRELVQRLGDKDYSWGAVSLLIPDMTTAGLLGHLYTCPDMIGGGQYTSFLNIDTKSFDQELIVRSCQAHALMPMMQFSVAPWRILDKKHLEICAHFAHLHEQMGSYILQTAKESAKTGEPIIRSMEYAYPNEGFAACKDQFMLGDRYLVAPMVTKGEERTVQLPRGTWKDEQGAHFQGPTTLQVKVPLERLPYYEKIK